MIVMQKAFNQVNSGNFPKMFGIPEGFPFAGMPDDLMNMMSGMNMGMPEKQKIKKKKPDDQVKPIDLKAIPSPHQIHASLKRICCRPRARKEGYVCRCI